ELAALTGGAAFDPVVDERTPLIVAGCHPTRDGDGAAHFRITRDQHIVVEAWLEEDGIADLAWRPEAGEAVHLSRLTAWSGIGCDLTVGFVELQVGNQLVGDRR